MTIRIVEFFQSLENAFTDPFFQLISYLGEESIYIVALAFIYFAYNKKLGEMIGFSLLTSQFLNTVFKNIVQAPRPFEKYPDRVVNLRPETSSGYSFPSGHTQIFSSVWMTFAAYKKRNSIWAIVIVLSILMGMSRMYLGVHFLEDVSFSFIFSIFFALFVVKMYQVYEETPRKLHQLYGITFVLMALLIIFIPTKSYVTGVGMFGGFISAVIFEKTYVNFDHKIEKWKLFIRFLIGIGIMLTIRILLKGVFSLISNNEIITIIFDFIRYYLLVFVGFGIYPYYFKKYHF